MGWFELYWLLIKKAVCLLYVRYIDLHGCNAYLIDFGWYFTAHYVCVFDEWFFSLAFISFHGRFQYLPPRTENAFILPNLCCNTVSFPVYKMKVSLNFFFYMLHLLPGILPFWLLPSRLIRLHFPPPNPFQSDVEREQCVRLLLVIGCLVSGPNATFLSSLSLYWR